MMKKYLYALHFSLLKVKLMFEKNWDEAKCNLIEIKYKNFLYLHMKYRDTQLLVPTTEIDEFWHGHILDTKSYREHTQFIFGHYLDHDPYGEINERGEVDEFVNAFKATRELYS